MKQTRRTYHGWIFAEKSDGFKDHFSVQYKKPNGETTVVPFGRGERAATQAVAHFEEKLGLGPVKLEQTPLGLRVFTMEEVSK